MKSKKIISLICTASLAISLLLAFPAGVHAQQSTDTKTATQTGTADQLVEVNLTDGSISYGTLNISAQASANSRTDSGVKYVIFESQYDLSNDSIAFNEGATNSNAFYRITSAGETYPATGGLDSTNWIYLRDITGNAYVTPRLTGNLSSGGAAGITMPSGFTQVGSTSFTQYYYTSADLGVTWTRNSQTIYVALGNDGTNNRLFVSNSATLSGTQYFTAKGEARNDSFNNGNSMVLTSAFPALATDPVTLDFGYNIPWDNTQGNATKTLYTLVDMPEHAATGHPWQWNLGITGEFVSNP